MSVAWTEQECHIAAALFRTGGYGHQHRAICLIAKTLGRSIHGVTGRFRKHGPTFEGPDKRRKHRRKPEGELNNHNVVPVHIPPSVWADRERRAQLEPLTRVAKLSGDPLPGYSEWDRRNA